MTILNKSSLQCIDDAIHLAKNLSHAEVGLVHLLNALFNNEAGYLSNMMNILEKELSTLQEKASTLLDKKEELEDHPIAYSSQLVEAISVASHHAQQYYTQKIHPEQLLLGIIDISPAIKQWLIDLNITEEMLQRAVKQLFSSFRDYSAAFQVAMQKETRTGFTQQLPDKKELLNANASEQMRVLDITALPEHLLYIQYLSKAMQDSIDKAPQKTDQETKPSGLSPFDYLQFNLFKLEEALKGERYAEAQQLKQEIALNLKHIIELQANSKIAELKERLDLVEDIIDAKNLIRFRNKLQSIESIAAQESKEVLRSIGYLSTQIRQSLSPKERLVCKVNVFAQGHRNVIEIKGDETLTQLRDYLKNQYRDEINNYLYKMHDKRIPLSKINILFYSDAVDIEETTQPLHYDTMLMDLPERDTEGVSWYPQWADSGDEVYVRLRKEDDEARQAYTHHRRQLIATTRSQSPRRPQAHKNNPYKASGINKYKDFDYKAAIEDFNKALEIDALDVAVHFNLACAYSMDEQKEKSFHHIAMAVENGFTDLEKIKNHEALAFIRIQDEFDTFEANGFKSTANMKAESKEVLEGDSSLLEQLQQLAELRNKGLLTEEEFVLQKKKLLD